MSSYFQGQGYSISALPSNQDVLGNVLTSFAGLQKQKLANRSATLNNAMDNATQFGIQSQKNNQNYAEGDDFQNLLIAQDQANRDSGLGGLYSPGELDAIKNGQFTGASYRALLPTLSPFQRGREYRLADQTYTNVAKNSPNTTGADVIGTGALTGGAARVGGSNAPAPMQQQPSPMPSGAPVPLQMDSTGPEPQPSAPMKLTPGQPLQGGVSASPPTTTYSNAATGQSTNPLLFQGEKADTHKTELANVLSGNQVTNQQDNLDRIGYDPSGQPKVKFKGGYVSNIPVDKETEQLLGIAQNQVITGGEKYAQNQASTNAAVSKYKEFYSHLNNLEQLTGKYGDLQHAYNAIQVARTPNQAKYVEGLLAQAYPGMQPQELRGLMASVDALKSYRPTFVKDAGDTGNLSQTEQDVFNFLTNAGEYLDPSNMQVLKQFVNSKVGNPLYKNGIVYNVPEAAEFAYQVRSAQPSITKSPNVNIQGLAPATTQSMQSQAAPKNSAVERARGYF